MRYVVIIKARVQMETTTVPEWVVILVLDWTTSSVRKVPERCWKGVER